MEQALTDQDIALGLNRWMDKFIADPQGFCREWETVQTHQAEQATGAEPSYGVIGAAYLRALIAEPIANEPAVVAP